MDDPRTEKRRKERKKKRKKEDEEEEERKKVKEITDEYTASALFISFRPHLLSTRARFLFHFITCLASPADVKRHSTRKGFTLSIMNPCADDFRPLSTPAIDSSSSVITLDRDAGSSGSAGIRFRTPESDQTYQVIEPLPYDLEQALAPLQIPLFNQATPYSSLPYGFPFGSHQIWSVQPWYNPVVVSGRDCGTSLQPLHDSLSFRPMNTMLAHTSRLQPSTIANPEVVIERPSTIKPAPGRQLEQDPLSKQLNQDELGSNIKRRDLEYLISGLKPLACTASVARGCRIGNSSRGLRKTARKTREKSSSVLGSTQDLCHHGRRRNSDLSVERLSSLPSCASSAGSATSAAPSATSSPPWSDNTLLLMNEGLSSSDVLSLDTLKLPDSLHSFNFSLSDESNSLQKLPHLQNIASSASPQTSPQQQSLLPFEAQQLTELETVKSSEQSSKTLTDLSQGINSLSISDTTVSVRVKSPRSWQIQKASQITHLSDLLTSRLLE